MDDPTYHGGGGAAVGASSWHHARSSTCDASVGCLLHPHGQRVPALLCQARDSGPLCTCQAHVASTAIGHARIRSLQSVRRPRVQARHVSPRSLASFGWLHTIRSSQGTHGHGKAPGEAPARENAKTGCSRNLGLLDSRKWILSWIGFCSWDALKRGLCP